MILKLGLYDIFKDNVYICMCSEVMKMSHETLVGCGIRRVAVYCAAGSSTHFPRDNDGQQATLCLFQSPQIKFLWRYVSPYNVFGDGVLYYFSILQVTLLTRITLSLQNALLLVTYHPSYYKMDICRVTVNSNK